MLLNFPTRKFEKIIPFSDLITGSEPKRNSIFGFANALSKKEWVLVEKKSLARVYTYQVKQNVLQMQLQIQSEQFKVVKVDNNNYVVITKLIIDDILEKHDITRLIEEFGDSSSSAISYIINSTRDYEQYIKWNLGDLLSQHQTKQKQDVTQKVVKQFYNKQFKGQQLYELPKYLKQTGNWDDKETIKLIVK